MGSPTMRQFFLAGLILTLVPAVAQAHALGIDCKLRDGKVKVEAFYDDDSPAQNAKVQVVNAKEEVVASGTTDAQGLWSFLTPAPGRYEVRVDAGAGHRAKKAIDIPAPTTQGDTISEGTTRAEFTRIPWLKVLIGLAVIGSLGGAFLLASLIREKAKEE